MKAVAAAVAAGDRDTAQFLIDVLGSVGPGARGAIAELVGMLADVGSSAVPFCGTPSAGLHDHAVAARALREPVGDPGGRVRAAAASSVGTAVRDLPEARPALQRLLADGKAMVRLCAAEVLRALGAEPALLVPVLIALLEDPWPDHHARPALRALREVLASLPGSWFRSSIESAATRGLPLLGA